MLWACMYVQYCWCIVIPTHTTRASTTNSVVNGKPCRYIAVAKNLFYKSCENLHQYDMPHKNPYPWETFRENSHQYYIRVTQESISVVRARQAPCVNKIFLCRSVIDLLWRYNVKWHYFLPPANSLCLVTLTTSFTFKCSFPVSEWVWVVMSRTVADKTSEFIFFDERKRRLCSLQSAQFPNNTKLLIKLQ